MLKALEDIGPIAVRYLGGFVQEIQPLDIVKSVDEGL